MDFWYWIVCISYIFCMSTHYHIYDLRVLIYARTNLSFPSRRRSPSIGRFLLDACAMPLRRWANIDTQNIECSFCWDLSLALIWPGHCALSWSLRGILVCILLLTWCLLRGDKVWSFLVFHLMSPLRTLWDIYHPQKPYIEVDDTMCHPAPLFRTQSFIPPVFRSLGNWQVRAESPPENCLCS